MTGKPRLTVCIIALAVVCLPGAGGVFEAGAAEPELAMNINAASYYDGLMPFVELTRHGSGWISHGRDGAWDDERPIAVDENGYPTSLEPDQNARMVIFLDQSDRVLPSGNYTLTWEGEGTIVLMANGHRHEISGPPPEIWAWSPSEEENSLFLIVESTVAGDHLRNIRLFAPGFGPESTTSFAPHLGSLLEPFEPIRFMDWGLTNDSTVEAWSHRARLSFATWGDDREGSLRRGVPYEVQIDLGNLLDKDIWLCVPHRASDDFVARLAALVRDRLEPGLRVYLEYTNEHWNGIFAQSAWLRNVAAAETEDHGFTDGYTLHHAYARRASEVFVIFADVIADRGRVVNVIAAAADYAWPIERIEEELERLERWPLVDAVAVAPYWALGTEERPEAYDLAVSAMADGEVTEAEYREIFSALETVIDDIFDHTTDAGMNLARNKEIADRHGLPLIAYEGGQHIVAWGEDWNGDPDLGDVAERLNSRPEMYDAYRRYLDGWAAFGGGTLALYHLAGGWYELESFGHLRDFAQPLHEAHKYRALIDWLRRHSSTAEVRRPRGRVMPVASAATESVRGP